jgi:hypothetical protein
VFDAAGAIRGPLIGFQTWKAWSPDCRATTVWRGRMINPTTVVVKWVMTYGGRSVRGVDTFRRIWPTLERAGSARAIRTSRASASGPLGPGALFFT